MAHQLAAKDVAVVGIRLFGLFELWKGISGLFAWLYFFVLESNPNATGPEGYFAKAAAFSLTQAVVGLTIGVLCVWKSEAVVRRLFPEYREAYFTLPMVAVQRTAFAIIGLALAASSAPSATTLLIALVQGSLVGEMGALVGIMQFDWPSYARSAAGVAVGLGLFLSSGWLSRHTPAA